VLVQPIDPNHGEPIRFEVVGRVVDRDEPLQRFFANVILDDGDDIIIGGLGNDVLRGGTGADSFVVAHVFGAVRGPFRARSRLGRCDVTPANPRASTAIRTGLPKPPVPAGIKL
jgi:hypothetical protein